MPALDPSHPPTSGESSTPASVTAEPGLPWRDHLGLIVSAAAFVIVAMRVLGVSQWNVNTARAVIQAGGATNVAIGSAIASLPAVAGVLVLIFGVIAARSIATRSPLPSSWSVAVIASLGLLLMFVVPMFNVAVALVAVLVGLGYRWRPGASKTPTVGGWHAETSAVFAILVASQLVIMSGQSWMPSERLTIEGQPAFTGYVVGRDGGDLVVLRARARGVPQIKRVPQRSLRRAYCDDTSAFFASSVLELGGSGLPDCPD